MPHTHDNSLSVAPDWTRLRDFAKAHGVHPDTVVRWSTRGVAGHRLRLTKVGGRLGVRRRDMAEFHTAINAQTSPNPAVRETLSNAPEGNAGV